MLHAKLNLKAFRLLILLTLLLTSLPLHYPSIPKAPLDLLHFNPRLYNRILRKPQLPILLTFPFLPPLSQVEHRNETTMLPLRRERKCESFVLYVCIAWREG